eukprot:TRINITY_DN426_c0_g1_i1.p1 TRINITY_DN426_c0_g1~~TRINITY_DN426_c0_g1_i1.p1  ORF type:complete len:127 (-),score=45.42 TRINITY_DN426_c0_g1_i1:252-632(-)
MLLEAKGGNANLIAKNEVPNPLPENFKELEPMTPLQCAAENGHLDIVDFLLQKGADVNKQVQGMPSALHYAAGHGHIEVVKSLLKAGASIKLKTNGKTASDAAKAAGQVECAKILEKAKMNPKNWF